MGRLASLSLRVRLCVTTCGNSRGSKIFQFHLNFSGTIKLYVKLYLTGQLLKFEDEGEEEDYFRLDSSLDISLDKTQGA